MIPAIDLKFLRAVVAGMRADQLTNYIHGDHRAAQAMVLRWNGPDGIKVSRCFSHLDRGAGADAVLDRLERHMDLSAPSSLSLFYLLRADIESNRYGGQVSFPGGRRDFNTDKDDLATAMRETYEEVGFPLSSPEFVFLGRLPDAPIRSKDTTVDGKLLMSRFVFLHIGEMTPTLQFSHHEVAGVQWVRIADLSRRRIEWDKIQLPLGALIHWSKLETRQFLRDMLPNTYLAFPSIPLPEGWQLWGNALAGTSLLLHYDGRPRLDYPIFRASSLLTQVLLVWPYHGYLNVVEGERPVHAVHLLALLFYIWVAVAVAEALVGTAAQGVAEFRAIRAATTATSWERTTAGNYTDNMYDYPNRAKEPEETVIAARRQVAHTSGSLAGKVYGPPTAPVVTSESAASSWLPPSFWGGEALPTGTISPAVDPPSLGQRVQV